MPEETPRSVKMEHMELSPCSPWRAVRGTDPPAACGSHAEADGFAKEGHDPVGSPEWSRLLAGFWSCGERSPRWSGFTGRACDPLGPVLKQLVKKHSPWEGLTLEKFVGVCVSWDWSHFWARERLLSLRRKNQKKKKVINWLQPPAPLKEKRGKEAEYQEKSLNGGRNERKMGLRLILLLLMLLWFWLITNSISLSWLWFAHDNLWSFPALFSIQESLILFSLPYPVKEGRERVFFLGAWQSARVTQCE